MVETGYEPVIESGEGYSDDRSNLVFKPSARLQRYLGQELIADPNLAIIEFVKNAYDAGASLVLVDFELANSAETSLTIADDGVGMDLESFEKNWMHPGYSSKSPEAPVEGRQESGSAAGKRQKGRVPVGEKGLGRLAAGRLGKTLEIFTRPRPDVPWLHVFFDWARFEDMTKLLEDVKIPYDLEVTPEVPPIRSGTYLIIRDLSFNWAGRVPGRPVPGRKRTRLGRLKQDLELLIRPFGAFDQDFTTQLRSDIVVSTDDVGYITPADAVERSADYSYNFSVDSDRESQVVIERELLRGDEIINALGGERREQLPPIVVSEEEQGKKAARPYTLECGPFRGTFLYSPPPAAKRAREIDAIGSNVLLYRDGFLVEPYGLDGNDWVGVAARKAQRQGHALIQPMTFSGYVLISRDRNSEIKDMSNRQGLIDNDASEVFIAHVQAQFRDFESLVQPELERRWESKVEKAGQQAEESAQLAAIRLRAVAHSLGQPLMGLGAEIVTLKDISAHPDTPEKLKLQLDELTERAERHLGSVERIVQRIRDEKTPSFSEVPMPSLVSHARDEVAALAQNFACDVHLGSIPRRSVLVPRELVFEALAELLRNAIEADRPSDSRREVRISAFEESGDVVVEISDNGLGISGANSSTPLSAIRPTKGCPSEGLAMVETAVAAARGRVVLVETGEQGTRFRVYLPTGVKSVRMQARA